MSDSRLCSWIMVAMAAFGCAHPAPGAIAVSRQSPNVAPTKSAQDECEELMNAVLPFAQTMLSQYREFHPFGGAVGPTGAITQVAGWTGSEFPAPEEVVKLLEEEFRNGAVTGKYRATALVVDVRTVPPGKVAKQDAIEVRLDHKDRYSVRVIFPYSFNGTGQLQIEGPFAIQGEGKIFPR